MSKLTTFDFFPTPKIVFGPGQIARLGELAAPLGQTALLVWNGPDETLQRIAKLLASHHIRGIPIRQRGEPTVGNMDVILETARAAACDCVIGLGGGSAIDAAKAAAGLLTNPGNALDYLEVIGRGQKITRPAAPWIAIPTTAGTGAEVTRNAVIGYPEKSFKASLRSELLLPRIALVDPQLAVGVSPAVTARTGMDALCQCIEAYTSTGASPMTDALALEGIRRAAGALQRAFLDGNDLDARADLALAALFSGIALTNAGLGAVHGFAAPLGAAFPIPHGTACAALLAPVMLANCAALRAADPAHPALARYATIGRILTGEAHLSDPDACGRGSAFVGSLRIDLDIPNLGAFGILPRDIPAIVALAQKSSSMRFNPVKLQEETLRSILEAAL